MSGFTLGVLLQGQTRKVNKLKVLITHLLLVLEVWDGKPTYKEIMGCESFGVVRFDLGPLLQGQMIIAEPESAYNSLIIGPRGLGW